MSMLLMFTAVGLVFADTLVGDADALTNGNQTNVFLSSTTGGLTQTFDVDLSIDCGSQHHLDGDAVIGMDSGSTIPAGGSLAASPVTIPRPSDWPADSNACGSSTSTATQTSVVQVQAPSADGDYTFQLRWLSSDGDVTIGDANVAIHFHVGAVTVPSNTPPTVDAGGPYSGPEGSSISINGASASDPDAGDSVASLLWTKVESGFDAGSSCTVTNETTISPSLSCTDDGSVALTLTATDTNGATNSASATVTVGNASPAVTSASLAAGATTCSANLNAAFTDAGINDTHTASVAWGDATSSAGTVTETAQSGSGTVAASHAYSTIGAYVATVTVSDDDLGQGSLATSAYLAGYTTGGILQPINPGPPSSIFKWGSTIPVKIQITNCNGTTPTTVPLYITIKSISGNTPATGELETTSTSAADTNNLMRFSTNLYIYNLYTKTPYFPDPTATYMLTIHYGSSGGPTVAAATIGLRN
jgi:hypothetical protein